MEATLAIMEAIMEADWGRQGGKGFNLGHFVKMFQLPNRGTG